MEGDNLLKLIDFVYLLAALRDLANSRLFTNNSILTPKNVDIAIINKLCLETITSGRDVNFYSHDEVYNPENCLITPVHRAYE
jgi:hypothetical protein